MIKALISIFLIGVGVTAFGQQVFSPHKISRAQIPVSIKFRGTMQEAWSWKDKLGDNILITSSIAATREKDPDPSTGDEAYSAELHAFHFVKKDTGFRLLWRISDSEKRCSFDLTAAFLNGATQITDLDQDGIAETCVQYKLACRSDVSPAFMKLIMHEDTTKYALRGHMWVQASADEKFTVTESEANLESLKGYKGTEEEYAATFGRYLTEKEFATAPSAFIVFARRQWMKYVKESFD
jgi:hypothetical protein